MGVGGSRAFLRKGAAHGSVPAVVDGSSGRSLTFESVSLFAERAAAGLAARHGFARGDALAVFCPPLPDVALAMAAAVLSGGVVAPLCPALGVEALAAALRQCGARVVVTVPALVDVVRAALASIGGAECQVRATGY